MKLRPTRAWALGLGVALALTATGVAVADPTTPANPSDWYDGDSADVADPHRTTTALGLYDASGTPVTTGTTTAPLPVFAAAAASLRDGDQYASLFVHLPQPAVTPGAWPGLQVTGTSQWAGEGTSGIPGALAGRPLARTAGGYTLADVVQALPHASGEDPGFAGVYELRLRTSSRTQGVGTDYAATWLKVTGTTWTVTTAPVAGGGDPDPEPEPVATTVTPTWPARLTYGTAAPVPVTVTAASGAAEPTGTVRLTSGATTLSTATLTSAGTATLTVPRTALTPGSRSLAVVYSGATGAFTASSSPARAYAVGKAAPGRPTVTITKKPSAKKPGSARVVVPTPAGLAAATGRATVTLKKGRATKQVAATLVGGAASVKLPKLPKGTWTLSVSWPGDTRYLAAPTVSVKLPVKAK